LPPTPNQSGRALLVYLGFAVATEIGLSRHLLLPMHFDLLDLPSPLHIDI
jgi:hypothetical protein